MLRAVRIFLGGLLGLVLLLWAAVWIASAYPGSAIGSGVRHVAVAFGIPGQWKGQWEGQGETTSVAGSALVGGPFHLVDQHGQAVSDATYRGRWMLVYFGYSFCPDVCPTELQTITAALKKLGPRAAQVAPIFITVDPARDTPQVLAHYVALFDPRMIGLTGTPEQVAAVTKQYRVYYAKAPSHGTDYAVDHSSFVYLMDPDGHFVTLFNQDTSADELATAIGEHIAHAS